MNRINDEYVVWTERWENAFSIEAERLMKEADSGHDLAHIRRVVTNAIMLGSREQANLNILLPAAWLHDCVAVAKNSPERSLASRMAANQALRSLAAMNYPNRYFGDIEHAIVAHSFSAGIPPETCEAKVLQDADRLEAVGAIGIARCFMTGGAMHQQIMHPTEPFPVERRPDDNVYSVDHFFLKLLGLHKTMQTESGKIECQRRTHFLIEFLRQLGSELNVQQSRIDVYLERFQ